MNDSVDAVDVNYLGERDRSPYYIILYVILVIVLCLLFTNMFVRIVIETFNIEKDFLSLNRLLSDQQRSWINVQILTYNTKPTSLLVTDSQSRFYRSIVQMSQSRIFENTIIACIILNTFVMALVWFDQPEEVIQFTEIINYFFMVIFTTEAIIKIIALKKLYFRDSWNIFDFTIVMFTLLVLILKIANLILLYVSFFLIFLILISLGFMQYA